MTTSAAYGARPAWAPALDAAHPVAPLLARTWALPDPAVGPRGAQAVPQVGVRQQAIDRRSQGGRIAHRHQQSCASIGDRFGDAADARSDGRHASGGGLQADIGQSLGVGRMHQQIERADPLRQVLPEAGKAHALLQTARCRFRGQGVGQRAAAEHDQLHRGVSGSQRLQRLEQSAAAEPAPAPSAVEPLAASPEYVEPMVLARRGLDAPAIAARCGITLGEAELLVAMARGDRGTAP